MKIHAVVIGVLLLWSGFACADETSGLSELAGTPDFFVKLQQEYKSKDSPEEALALIRTYLPIVQAGDQRHTLLLDMARIEEQQSKLQSAQLHYQSAAFAPSGAPDYQALFMSALLLIDFAEYDQALLQCRHVIRESSQETLRRRARLQEARILLLQGKSADAAESLDLLFEQRESLSAEVLYGMHLLYAQLPEDSSSRTSAIQRLLKESYPDSPEYGLLQKRVHRSPTPETALGITTLEAGDAPDTGNTADAASTPAAAEDGTAVSIVESSASTEAEDGTAEQAAAEKPKSRAIQTGSFQDAENAHYMQRELENRGFTAMVAQAEVNGTTFFRVLVPIAYGETEENIVLRLKEKGFEGYPVY